MVFPLAVPKVDDVALAGVAAVSVAIARAHEAAEDAMLHMKDREMLVKNDFDHVAATLERFRQPSNLQPNHRAGLQDPADIRSSTTGKMAWDGVFPDLGCVEVMGRGNPSETRAEERVCRQDVGRVEGKVPKERRHVHPKAVYPGPLPASLLHDLEHPCRAGMPRQEPSQPEFLGFQMLSQPQDPLPSQDGKPVQGKRLPSAMDRQSPGKCDVRWRCTQDIPWLPHA